MLKPRIQMRLQPQPPHDRIVMAVDMRVDTVQPLEQHAHRLLESFREGHAGLCGEEGGIGEVSGRPGEQERDVGWRGEACGFGVGGWIVPEVFEFVGGFHFGAGGGRAEFGDGAVEEVDLVVEVDDCTSTLALLL